MLSTFLASTLASMAIETREPAATIDCSRALAVPATIEAIMAEPDKYQRQCVKVRAITNGYALFASIEGYYRAGPLIGGDPETDPRYRERLGLDNAEVLEGMSQGELRHATAVGRVQDCETMREAAHSSAEPDQLVWISGFCHYANGPYLWLSHVDVGEPVQATRLLGAEMRAKIGNLSWTPSDWPHRKFVDEKVYSYLKTLQQGDRAAFAQLHLESEKPTWKLSSLRLAFGEHPGFTALRRMRGMPQTAIFLERLEHRSQPNPNTEVLEGQKTTPDYDATICFCIRSNCNDLWPINTIDADNREDRPYVCTELHPYVVFGRGTFPAFSTERGRHGLPEPRR